MLKSSIMVALLACAATPALAQYDRNTECWNPRAGHFEQVRPGEYQGDLDFGRCRMIGEQRGDYRGDTRGDYRGDYRGAYRTDPNVPRECWNPNSRHFEAVRPDERQDDLDFSRCQLAQGGTVYQPRQRYYGARECWNPRARHFEEVREAERQDDLDFARCRPL